MANSSGAGQLMGYWGKTNEKLLKRRKIIRICVLSAIGLLVILLAFFSVFSFTDVIYKPETGLNSNPAPGDWSMFGRDILHSGSQNASGNPLQGSVEPFLVTGSSIGTSPVAVNGLIYVGARDGNLYALDLATGSTRWVFKTGSWVESSPAVVNNVVYFGSNDGQFYALEASTGKKLWDYKGVYPIKSSPAVADGKVYFGCDDYRVYALDTATGKKIWSFDTGDAIPASPVVANGLVFIGSWDNHFYTLDANSGRLHLRMPSIRSVNASAVVVENTVYFSNSQGSLLAMDGRARNWIWEGKIKPVWDVLHLYGVAPVPPAASGFLWTLNLGGVTNSSPTIFDNTLYIGAAKKIIAVDLQNHKKLWETSTGGIISSAPVVVNDTVYVTARDGHLYLLKTTSGEILQNIPIGGEIGSNPLIVGNTVFVSSLDGILYSVN